MGNGGLARIFQANRCTQPKVSVLRRSSSSAMNLINVQDIILLGFTKSNPNVQHSINKIIC